MTSEKAKMIAGELYRASAPELQADNLRARRLLDRYNAALAVQASERLAMLRELLGEVGADVDIRPPFFCDYGYNIRMERGVFLNYNCVILDVTVVVIGEGTQIGSAVQILTADHPRDPQERRAGLEYGRPVTIGSNVWIGSGALILPGVSVGDDAIIGAGSVVTRNVPSGATVAGNPARRLERKT